MAPSFSSAPLSFADKMQRLCVYVLILALALATSSEASWRPRSQLQEAPLDPGANRGLEPRWLDRLGAASHQRRQLGLQGPPQLVAGRSCDSCPCLSRPAKVDPGLGLQRLDVLPISSRPLPALTLRPVQEAGTVGGGRRSSLRMDGLRPPQCGGRGPASLERSFRAQPSPSPAQPHEKPLKIN